MNPRGQGVDDELVNLGLILIAAATVLAAILRLAAAVAAWLSGAPQPTLGWAAGFRVLGELAHFRVAKDDIIISTNVRTRLDGTPRSDQPEPGDPGVAVYREMRAGKTKVMAIDRYDGHMSEVARRLGIGRSTLYRKLKEFGLEVDITNEPMAKLAEDDGPIEEVGVRKAG